MSTLKQVSAQAGVHISTASMILHGGSGNSRAGKEAQTRVLEAARQLGYARNEAARSLRSGTSDWAGLAVGDVRNPFFAELAAALEEKLAAQELRLMTSHVAPGDSMDFAKASTLLQRQSVRCIIRWDEGGTGKQFTDAGDIPIIPIGFTTHARPGIWLDLVHALDLCVNHLKSRCFRKVGFFSPHLEHESPSVRIRREVFVDSCRMLNFPEPVQAQWQGESWDLTAAVNGALRAWKEYPEVEAWVGFNDVAALGLLIVRPGRGDVVAFDGTAATRSWPGPLTFLDLCIPQMAQRVADVIMKKSDLKDLGKQVNWIKPVLRNAGS